MINNELRIGNFTSSRIAALTTKGKQAGGFGVAAITYISEKKMERMLGRSLDAEVVAKPLTWGKLLESRVFDLLPTSYTLTSKETDVHPDIPYWAGSKDGTHEVEERAVIDIKCPITLKSFCQLIMPLQCGLEGAEAMAAIRNGFTYNGVEYEKHKEGDTYYWQLVSNAILNGTDYAELIIYMPYYEELPAIRIASEGVPGAYWIYAATESELPYILEGGAFKNINTIRFKVPQADKEFLTSQVLKAGDLLFEGVAPVNS